MPSPFPGMDPFLEHPDFFPDLHGRLHVHISEALQASLPPPYFAVIGERLWVESSSRFIEPDTDVIYGGFAGDESNGGGVAVAARPKTRPRTRPLVFEVTDDEQRQAFVEVRRRLPDGGERVVTVIEVLSLSNKTPGEKGRDLYLEKQDKILRSPIHLVEIDLLRAGRHTTPVWIEKIRIKSRGFDYHVSVHQFNQGGRFSIYAWKLADMLPEIAVPLLPADGDVALDLQAVFTRCYDTGPYRRRVQYDPACVVPPLDAEQTAWALRLLEAAPRPAPAC